MHSSDCENDDDDNDFNRGDVKYEIVEDISESDSSVSDKELEDDDMDTEDDDDVKLEYLIELSILLICSIESVLIGIVLKNLKENNEIVKADTYISI